jgi:hypothetical protein
MFWFFLAISYFCSCFLTFLSSPNPDLPPHQTFQWAVSIAPFSFTSPRSYSLPTSLFDRFARSSLDILPSSSSIHQLSTHIKFRLQRRLDSKRHPFILNDGIHFFRGTPQHYFPVMLRISFCTAAAVDESVFVNLL